MPAEKARGVGHPDLCRHAQQANGVGHAGHADVDRQLDPATPHALDPGGHGRRVEAHVADDVGGQATLVPHRLDGHVVVDERMAFRIARDADLRQVMACRQRVEKREGVGELARRLRGVAGDDEDVVDAALLERVEDLAQLVCVADQAGGEMWHRAVAHLRQPHSQEDGGGHAAPGRGGDGDRDLPGHIGRHPVRSVIGGQDLIAGRAEEGSQDVAAAGTKRPTWKGSFARRAHLRCRTIRSCRAVRNTCP